MVVHIGPVLICPMQACFLSSFNSVPLTSIQGVTVVIPAYNAAKVIASTLDDVQDWLDAQAVPYEVIVVDDGSKDATATVVTARGRGVRLLVNRQNCGKGASVRRGMLAGSMPWRVFLDADNSTRIDNLLTVDREASNGANVVIASRRAADSNVIRKQHPIRRFLGNSAPMLTKLIALPDLSDTQCGFKAFTAEVSDDVFARAIIDRFMFDVEILLLTRRLGHEIREIGVAWDNPTESTLNVQRDLPQMLGDLFTTTWRLRVKRGLPAVIHTGESLADTDAPELIRQ